MVHPDMKALQKGIIAAKSETDLKEIVQAAVGPSGFMEFVRFELGEVLCKEQGTRRPRWWWACKHTSHGESRAVYSISFRGIELYSRATPFPRPYSDACCLRGVNAMNSVFHGLACHLSPCMLLKQRFFADSIPSALTTLTPCKPSIFAVFEVFSVFCPSHRQSPKVALSTPGSRKIPEVFAGGSRSFPRH
jgi:hypothetical protein